MLLEGLVPVMFSHMLAWHLESPDRLWHMHPSPNFLSGEQSQMSCSSLSACKVYGTAIWWIQNPYLAKGLHSQWDYFVTLTNWRRQAWTPLETPRWWWMVCTLRKGETFLHPQLPLLLIKVVLAMFLKHQDEDHRVRTYLENIMLESGLNEAVLRSICLKDKTSTQKWQRHRGSAKHPTWSL